MNFGDIRNDSLMSDDKAKTFSPSSSELYFYVFYKFLII